MEVVNKILSIINSEYFDKILSVVSLAFSIWVFRRERKLSVKCDELEKMVRGITRLRANRNKDEKTIRSIAKAISAYCINPTLRIECAYLCERLLRYDSVFSLDEIQAIIDFKNYVDNLDESGVTDKYAGIKFGKVRVIIERAWES